MLLCLCEVIYALPFTLVEQIKQLTLLEGNLLPYTSWEDVHYGFAQVLQIPSSVFDESSEARTAFVYIELARWVGPVSAFILFG